MKYCKNCGEILHEKRIQMGYENCVSCSTEVKWSGVPVINHKTGNEIQVVKDPEVAAEFLALSHRGIFGAFQGRPEYRAVEDKPEQNLHSHHKISDKILSRKLDTSQYDDEKVSQEVLRVFDKEGLEAAINLLNFEFQSLRTSPLNRKRLLLALNTFPAH